MSDSVLPTVEVRTGSGKPVASVIWLHGLGANGHDFEPVVPHLSLPDHLPVRFVFPNAPVRPVTINGGFPSPAWFDIFQLDKGGRQDEPGIRQAIQWTEALIAQENERGVSTDRIVLAGFSQGGAIALATGIRHAERLAGIIGLSTFLPLADQTQNDAAVANRQTPVLICHGSRDGVVPENFGKMSAEALKALDYPVEWQTYPMAHEVCMEEIQLIGQRLASWLGA